ncbi:hypothetical protein LPW11_03280 [Geomonas sp. RF6]|uniref:hypothetical protein n=1 Tax=Geomonas sp. RF6 TaxID=2897342 RepID=UPI001E6322AE|nr:hypothetical protein [Geomonas sp. RF6]UFS71221.1 hypothetical protein LPW11_03280 [Geomonas sp. RF6]
MHEAIPPNEEEPDVRKCRTGKIEASWLKKEPLVSHCLNGEEECKYGMSFAYGCLCKHPRHLDFTEEDEEE